MLYKVTGNLSAAFLTCRCFSLETFNDNAMKTSQICYTSLSFLVNCDAKMKWHQKDGGNLLVQLLLVLVSIHIGNLTGVNGAPDNMTYQQERWFQKEGKQWIQHWKVNKFLARLISTRVKFKFSSVSVFLFRQLVSDQ